MATDKDEPVLRNNDVKAHADKYGQKFVEKSQKLHDKTEKKKGKGDDDSKDKKPAGGYDGTPVHKAAPGYTLKITFHSAKNLPFADISLTSDPYLTAVLKTDLPKRHKQDPDVNFRTPTIHRNVNPVWNTPWVVAHVPATGFHLKARIYDEDPADHDDRLGNVHVDVPQIDEKWTGYKEREFTIKKRMGSKRAYTLRGCAALVSRNISMSGSVTISIENLGRSDGEGGRAYTIGPLLWKQHYSPLIGRLTGIKDGSDNKTSKYNFQAIQMQLQGPLPEHLYHRYVEFKPFVAGMFTSHSLRGRILNHALHHQHARIYNYDTSTKYGAFHKPCPEMTQKFLEFVHYDQGGRIFTYVITLDGQMRFTETGKEFGIDMLSKHTMHSDVSIYIAFSGEFFIRKLKHPHQKHGDSPDPLTETMPPARSPDEKGDQMDQHGISQASSSTAHEEHPHRPANQSVQSQGSHLSTSNTNKTKEKRNSFNLFHRESRTPSTSNDAASPKPTNHEDNDPSHYELIIDNDSGTYRPNAKYLPDLKKFLAHNFYGLKVITLDCQADEEKMQKLKKEQRERKQNSGKQVTYMQNNSMSSLSSSDEEELRDRAGEDVNHSGPKAAITNQWQKIRHHGNKDDGDEKEQDNNEKTPTGSEAHRGEHAERSTHDMSERAQPNNEYNEKCAFETSNQNAYAQHQHVGQQTQDYSHYTTTTTTTTTTTHRSNNTAFTNGQFNDSMPPPRTRELAHRSLVHDAVTTRQSTDEPGWGI